MADITLYFAPASRSFGPRWLLEELELPYAVKTISLRKGEQKSPGYLRINPMGKVPALTDGQVTVSGSRARMPESLDEALAAGPWLLGERFSAADVMLGSLLSIALFNRRIDGPPESFRRYAERLEQRPAFVRAEKATWRGA